MITKKTLLITALFLATVCGVQAQTTNRNQNTNPTTDGTTKNSGVGNATNGSASSTGASPTSGTGAVGANNGTSYGMQPTAPTSNTTMGSDLNRRKRPRKSSKNN